ncbi:prepilin peptidase CpaA [Azospirillum fermentarium]|uniref:hypothetical protein n=1 Tax=Azospirillum fermentarium TaxID=1233114 RepID=UPI002225E858|nr:hypothetical protein [Azospirillum fermentarium]MCW2247266.1 prepilin peptidase CpaA [Azospirillum fermentarium]
MTWGEPVIVALYALPLLLAMGTDLMFARIPWVVVAAFAAGLPVAALLGQAPAAWLGHGEALGLGAAAAALLILARAMNRRTAVLAALVAGWQGMDQILSFAMLAGILGALLAFGVFGTRLVLPPLFRVMGQGEAPLPRLFAPGAPVPYAMAVGLAGLLMTPRLPFLAVPDGAF